MNDNLRTGQSRYNVTPRISPERGVSARFQLDQDFYDGLMEELRLAQRNRPSPIELALNAGGLPNHNQLSDLPSRQQLESLIETTFWTSIEPEEGKLPLFSSVFTSEPGDKSSGIIDDDWDYRFQEPISFSIENVSNIAKLMPAVRRPEMWLVISPSKENKPNEKLSVVAIGHLLHVGLRVKVLAPGHLVIEHDGKRIANISGNNALCLKEEDRYQASSLWDKLDDPHTDSSDKEWRTFVRDTIVATVQTMRTLGCGGSLLIVPKNENNSSVQGGTRFAKYPSLARSLYNLVKEAIEERRDSFMRGDAVRQASQSLAQITTIDGATLVTRDLELVVIGATLAHKENNPAQTSSLHQKVLKLGPLEEGEISLSEVKGHRHKSVANFICDHHDVLGLVVSEDRHVSAFVWTGESGRECSWYQHLELTLF